MRHRIPREPRDPRPSSLGRRERSHFRDGVAGTVCGLVCLLGAGSCRSGERERAPLIAPEVTRGGQVVVEAETAQFFEARVLQVERQRVKVERSAGAEPLTVSLSDVYRVPSDTPLRHAGQLGLCRVGGGWRGCRVEALSPPELVVRLLDGESQRLASDKTIVASASTELNLRRAFLRAREKAQFASDASRAGEPLAPEGFRPSAGMHVVARRLDDSWQSGVVQTIGKEGVRLTFVALPTSETLELTRVFPEPAATLVHLTHDDFVLMRPTSPAEPWRIGRVRGVLERGVRVAGADGVEKNLGFRDVLRLARVESPR